MKKIFLISLAVVLALSVGIIGCTTPAQQEEEEEEEPWPQHIAIGVPGGETGPSYPILSGIGLMIEKYLDVPVSVTATGGHDATVLMSEGELHIMMPSTQGALEMLFGTEFTKEQGIPQIPARAWLQMQLYGVEHIVLDNSGITSFADLEGKAVCIGPKGSPVGAMLLQAIANIYGFDYESMQISEWSIPTEAYDGLKTGKFDVIQVGTALPHAADVELFNSYDGHILGFDEEHFAQLEEELAWIVRRTIPGGTYRGMDEDIMDAGIAMFVVTHRDMPDSFVYEMTKMVWENFEEFSAFHPACAGFKAEDVAVIVKHMPYHLGAIQYYREIDVWTEELDEIQANLLAELPPELR